MIGTSIRCAALSAVAVALGSVGASMAQPPPAAAPTAPPAAYSPSLADLMTSSVQSRHIKLGLAGKARNWTYAAYETEEMRNAFNRITRTIPVYRKAVLADLVAGTVKDPLDQIETAIKARDAAGFDAAYVKLTDSCNACHQGLEHAYVVIKAPTGSPYVDQSFSPEAAKAR
jgi:hypothetical protein